MKRIKAYLSRIFCKPNSLSADHGADRIIRGRDFLFITLWISDDKKGGLVNIPRCKSEDTMYTVHSRKAIWGQTRRTLVVVGQSANIGAWPCQTLHVQEGLASEFAIDIPALMLEMRVGPIRSLQSFTMEVAVRVTLASSVAGSEGFSSVIRGVALFFWRSLEKSWNSGWGRCKEGGNVLQDSCQRPWHPEVRH